MANLDLKALVESIDPVNAEYILKDDDVKREAGWYMSYLRVTQKSGWRRRSGSSAREGSSRRT